MLEINENISLFEFGISADKFERTVDRIGKSLAMQLNALKENGKMAQIISGVLTKESIYCSNAKTWSAKKKGRCL